MKKTFTLAAALLASLSLWAAATVTFTAEEIAAGTAKSDVTPHCSLSTSSNYICESSKVTLIQNGNSADASYNDNSKRIAFTVAAGKGTISKIVVHGSTNSTTAYKAGIVCWDDIAFPSTAIGSTTLQLPGYVQTGSCDGYDVEATLIEGTKAVAIYKRVKYTAETNTVGSGSNLGDGQTIRISEVTLTIEPECSSPETPLSISSDAPAELYEGTAVHLSFPGGNGAGKGLTLDGETFAELTWTAVAGEHTFVVRQDAYNGYCAQEAELTLNVLAASPVTAVTIDGPATGTIGQELVYTATAENATDFAWSVDGVDANVNAAEFTYIGTKGNHSIICKARNKFNATDEWIASDAKAVTVTKVCGELIRATRNGKNIDPVTGVIGGSAEKSTQDNGKLGGTGHYWKLTLASGEFMMGDIVTVNVSTAGAQGKIAITSDKEGTDVLGTLEDFGTTGDNEVTLTKGGVSTIWLSRDGTNNNYNGVVDAIFVTRACEDSNDATIHSLTVNGDAVAENDGLFEYTVSSSYEEPTVTIAFEIHPLATIKYGLSNPYELSTPEVGSSRGQAFTIIAEDGTEKTYTVQIYKSASLDDDATLGALTIGSYELTPTFDPAVTEYTVTKPYEDAMPVVGDVTATPNSSNAKGAEVTIAENVITITVTAENDDTKVYTVTVNNAPAVKKINEIILSNGYNAYIVEGQSVEPFIINGFYLAGTEVPTVSSYKVNDGTTWAIDGNDITLTGPDASTAAYSLVLEAVTPATFSANEIIFDGTESWVKAANGFDASKGGWKFSKTDDDYSREIAGKTHVEFFLPACQTVVLKAGSEGTVRDVRTYINGKEVGDKATLSKDDGITLVAGQSAPFILTVASAQTKGDGGVGSIQLTEYQIPTDLNSIADDVKVVKVVRNGQVLILRDGKTFNVLGSEVK